MQTLKKSEKCYILACCLGSSSPPPTTQKNSKKMTVLFIHKFIMNPSPVREHGSILLSVNIRYFTLNNLDCTQEHGAYLYKFTSRRRIAKLPHATKKIWDLFCCFEKIIFDRSDRFPSVSRDFLIHYSSSVHGQIQEIDVYL